MKGNSSKLRYLRDFETIVEMTDEIETLFDIAKRGGLPTGMADSLRVRRVNGVSAISCYGYWKAGIDAIGVRVWRAYAEIRER